MSTLKNRLVNTDLDEFKDDDMIGATRSGATATNQAQTFLGTKKQLLADVQAQIDAAQESIAAAQKQLNTHIADATLHFTEASIDHTAISNIGTNTHVQIDSHIADATLHFTEASIDHGSISGLGDDDHTQYLLADGTRSLSGNMAVDALITIDGRDISVDGTKLDTIETSADITDATNVNAAGAIMHSDISPAEGMVRKTGSETYTAIKSNLFASTDPGVGDDSDDGYSFGSLWINATGGTAFYCLGAVVGSAVWLSLGPLTDAEVETAYNNQVDVVSQADAEAGTATAVERWTPQRVAQAIAALGGSVKGEANAADIVITSDITMNDWLATGIELAANEEGCGLMTALWAAGTTPDIRFGFSYPTGCEIQWGRISVLSGTLVETNLDLLNGSGSAIVIATTWQFVIRNGANAGTVMPQFRQSTSNANSCTVFRGSGIRYVIN